MPNYQPPFWMTDSPTVETSWRAAPLPFPGMTSGVPKFNVIGLGARDFPITQNEIVGTPGRNTHNLCGTLHFRREEIDYGENAGYFNGDHYGVPVYSSDKIREWNKKTRQYDFVFVDEALPDLIDAEGVHTLQWKPVVQLKLTVDLPDGPISVPRGHGISAERAEFPWYYGGDFKDGVEPAMKYGGEWVKSLTVTRDYLSARIDIWRVLPSTARRRTNYWGYYGPAVSTSDNEDGKTVYITAAEWSFHSSIASNIYTPDNPEYIKGWAGTAKIHVPHTHRQNDPILIDKKIANNALQIFNRGFTEEILQDEITTGKWLDQYGRYDPGAGAEVFSGVGWQPVSFGDLVRAWLQFRTLSDGGAGTVRMRSGDGNSYRLTLLLRGYNADRELVTLRTAEVTISPAEPGNFSLNIPSSPAFQPDSIIIDSAERITESGAADITGVSSSGSFTVGGVELLGAYPFAGVGILVALRMRRGGRWGFPALSIPPDTDPMPENANSYYQRRIFRQAHKSISVAL